MVKNSGMLRCDLVSVCFCMVCVVVSDFVLKIVLICLLFSCLDNFVGVCVFVISFLFVGSRFSWLIFFLSVIVVISCVMVLCFVICFFGFLWFIWLCGGWCYSCRLG